MAAGTAGGGKEEKQKVERVLENEILPHVLMGPPLAISLLANRTLNHVSKNYANVSSVEKEASCV